MITQSSAKITQALMTAFLVTFKIEGIDGDDVGLDIIEFIAVKMKTREDEQVAELGYFVRANLLFFHLGQLEYPEVHARFVRAALAAPLGYVELARTFEFGSHGCHR